MSLQDSNLLFVVVVVVFCPYLNSPGTQGRVPIEYQQTVSHWQKRDPNIGFLSHTSLAFCGLSLIWLETPLYHLISLVPGRSFGISLFLVCLTPSSITWDCLLGERAWFQLHGALGVSSFPWHPLGPCLQIPGFPDPK